MNSDLAQTTPPLAPQEPTCLEAHGDLRIDDYYWLRNRDDPRVLAYLQAENEYTAAMMSHTVELQAQLYQELRGRLQEDDQSVPLETDGFFYYERTEVGRQYPIYCRRTGSMDAPEERLLDLNQLAGAGSYAAIGNFKPSPNHKLLAYSFDDAGDETYTLFVKDLATGALLAVRIPNTYYGLEWGADSQTLYYTVLDDAKRPYRVNRHRLGDDPAQDEVLLTESDTRFEVLLRKSKDNSLIVIQVKSNTTSEEWFLPADRPDGAPVVVEPRRTGIEYSVTRHLDRFFITTNEDALNFRVLLAPVAAPGRQNWQEFIPHRPEVLVQATDAFRDHLVIYEREAGLRHLRVLEFATGESHRIRLPEPVYALGREPNPTFETTLVRFGYESLVTPETVYDYDMTTRTLYLRKRQVVHNYDREAYESHRTWATAADGVQVPISLVHRKGLVLDGQNPTLLYGYGSYGATWDAFFDAKRISLLERGFVFALAHIRGGSEMGRSWYERGKLLYKKNTFTDFIACAEQLVALGYTSPQRLLCLGRSAGGLLMGAVANLRPDLFAGIVAGVPFVDVISTMLDASIPLTAQEYEEWGNPADPDYYAYMRSYSPYDNVEDKVYPHLLVTAGLHDPRVQYWEPAKWVAKLRRLNNNPNRVLLKTNLAAGHSGASGRYDALSETAFEYAFMLDVVGV
jgi:oligopeptidase B